MKKTILAIAAAMMMSANMMAQNTEVQQPRQPQQMARTEMIKQRTEMTAKEYGLNEEQSAKLLELNTQYADKIPMMGGPRGQRGQRPQAGEQRQRPQQDGQAEGQRGQRGQRPQMNFEEMRKNMEEYNAELQKIMTPEQYQKYQQAQQQRMQRMQQRGGRQGFGGGQRPQRPQE